MSDENQDTIVAMGGSSAPTGSDILCKMVGVDMGDDTITLQLPPGMRPRGMAIGERVIIKRHCANDQMKSYIENPGDCYTTTAPSSRPKPAFLNTVVRCVAWMALAWGVIGGWSILGEWWPQLNRLTKDQVTIIVALVLLWECRKKHQPKIKYANRRNPKHNAAKYAT